MRLRDISLRKRILFANFLMVFIPVVLLSLLGLLLFAGLHVTGTAREGELALLWAKKGPAIPVTYAVNALRKTVDTKNTIKVKDISRFCRTLEDREIYVTIYQNDQPLYTSPGMSSEAIKQTALVESDYAPAMMRWTEGEENSFIFSYTSPDHPAAIYAVGQSPLISSLDEKNTLLRNVLEILVFAILIIAILLIIWLGISLSRFLSKQILEPLAALRSASDEIRKGNLDAPLAVPTLDELGQTCRDFDAMRRDLKTAREEQKRYEQNRKELIAGISHDLATPLTVVKGYASGLREGIANTPEKQHRYIDGIYHTACSMEHLVESLFLFSKLDLGRIPFTLENVLCYRYFEDFVQEEAPLMAEQGLTLRLAGNPTTAQIAIDRMQFRRVLENLLNNSLKYKTAAAVDFTVTVTETAHSVTIHCADTGQGVPDESLPKLFDSFYRTDAARTNVTKGSGLGLAIAKQIIISMNGTIAASHTPGGGLTISITLPKVKEDIWHETRTHH